MSTQLHPLMQAPKRTVMQAKKLADEIIDDFTDQLEVGEIFHTEPVFERAADMLKTRTRIRPTCLSLHCIVAERAPRTNGLLIFTQTSLLQY